MVYLDNITSGQTVWIPKNEFAPIENSTLEQRTVVVNQDVTIVEPSGTYKGMSKVTIDATGYAQQNYDDGFDDGFLDGMSSGYTDGYASGYTSGSTDGFNSGYTSGQTDGFQSGYTSGETHQKSLLVSTALTENGTYTREDGWNEVEVNVDSGSTYESGYTSGYTDGFQSGYTSGNTDGYNSGSTDGFNSGYTSGYTDGYDSGYTSGNTDGYNSGYTSGNTDGYASGETVGYESGYTEGYASGNTDGFASGYTSGHTDGENAIIDTFTAMSVTENGQYGSSAHPLSSITVSVPQTGVSIPLSSITINSNTAITVNDVAYTGITVDVPLVYFDDYIHNRTMQSDPPFTYHIDTSIIPTTGTTMRVRGMSKGYDNGNTIIGHTEDIPYPHFRGFWTNGNIYFDNAYHSGRIQATWSGNTDGNPIDITFANFSIYNNITETMLATGSTYYGIPSSETLKVDVASWWVKQIEIWDGETKVFDGVAAHNSNGEIGLYDRISQKMYTNSDLDIVYENIIPEVELNKSFTATSNGNYTITPTVPSVTITDRFDSDVDRYYITATTSGYPLTGRYNIFYIEDEFDSSKGQIDVYIENGYLDYDDSDWDGGEVSDFETGDILRIGVRDANRWFTWYHLEDFNYHYDAMSAVTLNVNVDTASTYQDGYNSGYTDGYSSGYTNGSNQGYIGGVDSTVYGAYYPIESQRPGPIYNSYKTQITQFSGVGTTFEFHFTNLIDASWPYGMFINGYGDNFYLKYESTDSADTKAYIIYVSDGNGNSNTLRLLTKGDNNIVGYLTITQEGCEYGIGSAGIITSTASTTGDFASVLFSILFNPETKYNIVFNRMRVIANGTVQKEFIYQNGEIVDVVNNTTATTYDYSGNTVTGVLQQRLVSYPSKVLNS